MAHIGIGSAQGDDKAIEAVKLAVASPLLETKINGATHVIINISGDISLMDANDAASYVQDLAGENANIIFGAKFDESMTDQASITVIATGLEDVSEKIDMPGKQAAPGAGMAGGMQNRMVYPNQDFTQQQQADFIQLPSHSRQHLHMHIQVSRSHASLRARLSL
jgi:cell division protein FtsZ